MRTTNIFCLATAGVCGALAQNAYAPPQPAYAPPQQGYAPAAPAQYAPAPAPQYAPAPAPQYAPAPAPANPYAPTPKPYADQKKEHFDQFWDNLELCNAEYDLESCLISVKNRKAFMFERHVVDCTVDFVEGLCGALKYKEVVKNAKPEGGKGGKRRRIRNGRVKMDEDNCQTAAFADAFLVYNKMITDLNTALANNPEIETWAFATIKMALKATRNNVDCVTSSFFNFLNDCSSGNFISSKDIQCVEHYLNSSSCSFAEEDPHGWNLPLLIQRYGLAGAQKAVAQFKKHYHVDDLALVLPQLRKVMQSIADEDAQGIHYVSADYNHHSQKSSVNVCPENFLTMNEFVESPSGLAGLDEKEVAFHFPVNKTYEDGDDTVPADPITSYKTAHKQCAEWFKYTKDVYNASDESTYEDNRCFSISGYRIKFLETGESQSLSYHELDSTTAGGDKCYHASWKETESCSSHLTEWQMVTACCKSYHTVLEEHKPKPVYKPPPQYPTYEQPAPPQYQAPPPQYQAPAPTYQEVLLAEDDYAPPAQPAYQPPQPAYQPPQPAYQPAYYAPKPIVRKVTAKSLMYEYVVSSNSDKGALGTIDSVPNVPKAPQNVIYALDELAKKIAAKCEKLKSLELTGYFGKKALQYCASLAAPAAPAAEAAEAAPPATLLEDVVYKKPEPEMEIKLKHHPMYIGENYASQQICKRLAINLDFKEIVPLVSGRCFPQSCVLSQLASCMEAPNDKYAHDYGYDYAVAPAAPYAPAPAPAYAPAQPAGYGAQPAAPKYAPQYAPAPAPAYAPAYAPAQGGYAAPAPVYQPYRSLLASSSSVAPIAVFGFVAGMVVVAVAQAIIGRRQTVSEAYRVV